MLSPARSLPFPKPLTQPPAQQAPLASPFPPDRQDQTSRPPLPQPLTSSSALTAPTPGWAAQPQPPCLCWWHCRGTAQLTRWNPGPSTRCASGLYHYVAHQYLLVLATPVQVSFHFNYYSLISLTAVKHFDRSHFTPCLHASSPLVLLRR